MKKAIIFWTAVLLLFTVCAASAAATREQADAYGTEGLKLFGTSRFEAALGAYEKALAIYRELGLEREEAVTLRALGRTSEKLNRPDRALEYYAAAADIFRRRTDLMDLSDCLHAMGLVHSVAGAYDKAISSFEESLAVKQEIGDVMGKTIVLADAAEAYLRAGDEKTAAARLDEIAAIAEASADKRLGAGLLTAVATIYDSAGMPEATIRYAEKAMRYAREINDTEGLVKATIAAGDGYLKLPKYEKAIELYREAEKAATTEPEKIMCLDRIGTAYITAGDVDDGIVYKKQVLEYYRKTGDRLKEAMVLFALAACTLGDEEKAIQYLTEALGIFKEINNPIGEGFARAALAIVYFSKKDYKEAKRYSTQVLFIIEKAKLQEAIDPLYLGMLYVGKGQYRKAIPYFEKALAKNRETGNSVEAGYAAAYLGFSYKALNEPEKAVDYYKAAIDVAETIRADISAEDLRSAFFGGASFAYDEIVELLIGLGRTKEAFEYMERARSRSLLDLLGTRTLVVRGTEAQELVAGEERLRDEIKKLGEDRDIISGLTTLVPQQEKTTRGIKEAQDDYTALTERIRKRYPELGSLVCVRPLTLEQVQSLLPPGVRIVEYYLTEEVLYTFSVSKDDLAVFSATKDRDELADAVGAFREAITYSVVEDNEGDLLKQSRALYDLLLAPVFATAEEKTLIIVPHRTLHYLPFSALSDGDRYLIDTHTLIVDPSASVLEFVVEKKKAPTGRIIAFGNPTTAYNPLPFAEREVEEISAIMGNVDAYYGDRARETTGKGAFRDYAVIHLACHGKFREDDPLLSSLFLASDARNDGMLTVGELFALDLGRSSLVVLSACETGLSKVLNGDELIGLSRGFIYAGTPSLLATLWEVADDSTGALMVDFYANLKQGMTKPEALRRAQLSLKDRPGFESPFYWAPFEMIGDWN